MDDPDFVRLTAGVPHLTIDDIVGHPRMAEARRVYVDRFLAVYGDDPFMARLLIETGRFLVFLVAVVLAAGHDPLRRETWFTVGRLKQAMAAFGLASDRQIDHLVGRLGAVGFMTIEPAAGDRRVRILRPTEAMLAHDRAWLAAHYAPMTVIGRFGDYAPAMRQDPAYQIAQRRTSIAFLPFSGKLLAMAPELMLFFNHAAGHVVSAALIQAAMAADDLHAARALCGCRRTLRRVAHPCPQDPRRGGGGGARPPAWPRWAPGRDPAALLGELRPRSRDRHVHPRYGACRHHRPAGGRNAPYGSHRRGMTSAARLRHLTYDKDGDFSYGSFQTPARSEGTDCMHIPDGYLSPSTCMAAYVAAAPFWYVAVKRVKRVLHSKVVPLLAVVSAFSFVVMMFNLPIPGGTTAHAVGMAVAAIVLGPAAAILAISIALAIQALFFGDGGILAFGANAFNMAIVGTLTAWFTYRLISGDAPVGSPRRVVAAAVAGYVAINAAALVAALEFGIQPLLFTDATGAPLYAPYPLSVAIPAMMVAHLTIAGAAEAIITGGIVAYLQQSSPDLLRASARKMADGRPVPAFGGWFATRRLWAGLGVLMVASPLGLLAAGIAWGEWGAEDFADPAIRGQIAQASGNVAPPESVPQGLQHLSSFWTAPIPDYAPPFMHSQSFGYILSAVVGAGLILVVVAGLSWLMNRRAQSGEGRA